MPAGRLARRTSLTPAAPGPCSFPAVHRYYLDAEGKRVYTLKVQAPPCLSPSPPLLQNPTPRAAHVYRGRPVSPNLYHGPRRPLPPPAWRDLPPPTNAPGLLTPTLACPHCPFAPEQKLDPKGMPTSSAHPARFSPDDKYSRHRVTLKKRFGILPTQQPEPSL